MGLLAIRGLSLRIGLPQMPLSLQIVSKYSVNDLFYVLTYSQKNSRVLKAVFWPAGNFVTGRVHRGNPQKPREEGWPNRQYASARRPPLDLHRRGHVYDPRPDHLGLPSVAFTKAEV